MKPATAITCREIDILDDSETLVCTIGKGKRLFGEVKGGFFYFTYQDALGVRGMREVECRIPIVERLIKVEYERHADTTEEE